VSGECAATVTIESMTEKYSKGLSIPVQPGKPLPKQLVVLITGTTGNLGSELLVRLLRDERVKTIYAFNRQSTESDIRRRHEERLFDRGFSPELLDSEKLVYLEGDLAAENLGLSSGEFRLVSITILVSILKLTSQPKLQIQMSVTTIIHNAWRLDFNLSLVSFEPHIKGTRNLIDMARRSQFGSNTRFLFMSSIGSTLSWDRSLGKYPEEHVENVRYARGGGYGEAKYVSERVR
jgi:thioester reductase-like protein